LIPVLALLSNYDRENCLINVGTEGFIRPISVVAKVEVRRNAKRLPKIAMRALAASSTG
jgi:hypothetical protein